MDPTAQEPVPHTDDLTTTTTPPKFVFSKPPPDAPPVTFEMARNKVAEFYGIEVADIDHVLNHVASVRSSWKPTWRKFGTFNKFGFLYGILLHTPDKEWQEDCIRDFYRTFGSDRLKEKAEEKECLNLLYARKHPNHVALAFHKAACLIWNMAGGGDVTEGDDTDDGGDVDIRLAMVANRLRGLGG
ncbi:hypothetical protein HDU81_007509 [Chytriomyces hyalinus]|nr:hypothetical protein HDU81_007509 [Chytriomyces hyalinus]